MLTEIVINTAEQFCVVTDFDGWYPCSGIAFAMKSLHAVAVVLGILIAQPLEDKFTQGKIVVPGNIGVSGLNTCQQICRPVKELTRLWKRD